MVTHSHILAWKILWEKEPGKLQSRGSQTVGDDLVRMFVKDGGLWFSFLVVSLCGFGIRVMAAPQRKFGSASSFSIFGRV